MSGVPQYASVRLNARRAAEARARLVAQEAERARRIELDMRRRVAEVEARRRRQEAAADQRRREQHEQMQEARGQQAAQSEQRRARADARRARLEAQRAEALARREEARRARAAADARPAPAPAEAPGAATERQTDAEPSPAVEIPAPVPAVPDELVARAGRVLAEADALREGLAGERLHDPAERLARLAEPLAEALDAEDEPAVARLAAQLDRELAGARRELTDAIERRERHAIVAAALMRALPASLVVDSGSVAMAEDGTLRLSAHAPGSSLHVEVGTDEQGADRLVYVLDGPAVHCVHNADGTVSYDSHPELLANLHAAMEAEGVTAGPLGGEGRSAPAASAASKVAQERSGSR